MARLIRITTVPISLKLLLTGQMKYMSSRGIDITMVSSNGDEVSEVVKSENCFHIVIPFSRKITLFTDLYCLLRLVYLFCKLRPDIVHTHTPKAGLLGMLAARICRVQLRIHTIAGLPLMTATGLKRKTLERTERITYWAADYVLPNSKSILSYVKEHRFTKTSKLDMIGYGSTNGIDLSIFSRESLFCSSLSNIKALIEHNPKNKYLLSVSRIVKDKGIIELVDAFIELSQKYSNLRLILLGPIEEQRKEENLPERTLKEIHDNANILHISWSDKVEYFMSFVDLFVHASHREGFPNVVLQAGAMECPIVCSEIPGNIDIIEHNKTGFLFPVGDTKALVEVIDTALQNNQLSNSYSQLLRKQICSRFARQSVHEEIFNFYKSKLNFGQLT